MPSVLVGLALKATVILLLAGALAVALRRASAAVRHLVWAAALTGVALLPLASLALPAWRVAEAPRWATAPAPVSRPARSTEVRVRAGAERMPTPRPTGSQVPVGAPGPAWSEFVVPLWVTGTLGLLAWLAVGLARITALGRASELVQADAWVALVRALERELGLHRRVTLRRSRARTMPMTWGVRHPVILLPADADAWPAARRRDVLRHELAHVKRHDFVTQLVAHVACACYWFHPLAWLAARRLRVERERACDDYVIRGGVRPSDYAGHLLDIARSLAAGPAVSVAGVAMARRSHLADRLLDVLDAGRNRGPVPAGAVGPAWMAAACVVLPLAAVAPAVRPVLPPPALTVSSAAAGDPARRVSPARFDSDTLRWCTETGGKRSRSSSTSVNHNDHVRETKVRVVDGRCEVLLQADGEFTFTPDFTDIATLAEGGELIVELDDGSLVRRLELRGRASRIERTYKVDRVVRPFDDDARAWLAETLTFLLRRSGLHAEERAQWILERRGIDGLIEEIAQLRSDYARRGYYEAAVASGRLDASGFERLVARAGQEIESDYELAELLIDVAQRQPLTAELQAGFVAAARTVASDYERRRVLDAALSRPGLTPPVAAGMLAAASDIRSDYELAELLIRIQRARPVDAATRDPFFTAVSTIRSDYERRRVLSSVLTGGDDRDGATWGALLQAARDIQSDYELAELLIALTSRVRIDDRLRPAFDAAANTIGSSHESDRVMAALARSQGRSPARQ